VAAPAAKAMARKKQGKPDADFSAVVSNVRVTATGWSLCGLPVERIFMCGPVADGAGLNVTITGYGGDLHVALVVNPSAVDDPRELAAAMTDALEELVACTA
jgi:hypothetical protein